MKKLLPLLIALLISTINVAQTFVIDHISYQVFSNNLTQVRIVDYNVAGGTDVVIPETVNYNGNDYDVTIIHQNAFRNKGLTSVQLANSIFVISTNAFLDNNLTSIVFPNGLQATGASSFKNNQLTSVTFPSSIIAISGNSFENNQISSLNLPQNITNLGDRAFKNNLLTNVLIPSSITDVGEFTFQDNPLVSVIALPNTPPTIYTGTFGDRSGINLVIPSGTIGAYVSDPGAEWTGFNTVTENASLSNEEVLLKKTQLTITNEYIKIHTPNNSSQLIKHTLYNLSGQKVNEGKEKEISTTRLTKGLYILRIDFKEGSLTKKVMLH